MNLFLRYPDIKKNAQKEKKFPAHQIFWDWTKNWHRFSEAYRLKIDLPDFRN